MKRFIHDTLTILAALALVVVIVGTFAAAIAHARPLATSDTACVGSPAPVHAQADGSGVRAGHIDVRCPRGWTAFQGVMWFSDDGDQYGKWTYGGTRYVSGRGDARIAPWQRPYHGCGFWKQQVTIGQATRYSDVTWFCA